jgi:hypothetical protein
MTITSPLVENWPFWDWSKQNDKKIIRKTKSQQHTYHQRRFVKYQIRFIRDRRTT